MRGLDRELEVTLRATEASFHVRSIATFDPELLVGPANADASSWLDANGPDFDQFPVRDGDATIGVLLRGGDHRGKTVRQAMLTLREGLIVAADMPIAELIELLRNDRFRLVLRKGRLDGLVTQSDLLKLPVRMLLFGKISHLEICMREAIRRRMDWPEWLDKLAPGRPKELLGEVQRLRSSRMEPDPLELTNFSDAIAVLAALPEFGEEFRTRADAVRRLRNDVAHAKSYIGSSDEVGRLVDTVADTDRLIRMISAEPKASS